MKQNTNLETKVGIFLMLGIGLVCALIIIFGELPDLFKPTYTLTVKFPNASGLLKGSDVFLSGASIGKVTTDPQPIPDSQEVQVNLKIDKKIGIREHAQYVIGSAGLLGDKFVEVRPVVYDKNTPEDQKAPFVKDGDVIEGVQATDIDSIMRSSKPLIDKANDIADQLDVMIRKLNLDVFSATSTDDLKETIAKLRHMVDNGDAMITNANDLLAQAKTGKGVLGRLINDKQTGDNFRDLIANLKAHGPIFYHDDTADKSDKGDKSSSVDNSDGRKSWQMSEPLTAVVVAAGRSQRMGFDKLLTPLGGRPLLLHTLERILMTEVPEEVVLVIRPGSHAEMEATIAPLENRSKIRFVDGGAQRQDSVQAGLNAVSSSSEFVMVHDAARPFVTKELIDTVLAAARLSDAAVCGAPCSDSLKEVGEDGLVIQTIDRSRLWAVQTPQIFRTKLIRESYQAALKTGMIFTDDTAVVEMMGHPVRIVLYHGVNLKVTTPADWSLAEALLRAGEGEGSPGQTLRKQLHDMNNHLTPLLGYAYLLVNEFPDDSRPKKFAKSIQMAAERCQATTALIQKSVRELFPRKGE